MKIGCDDPRLAAFTPHGADRSGGSARLERFARSAQEHLAGQVGPLANLRSSAGCAWIISTDSPWIAVRLERLRHHQPLPCHLALEVLDADRRHEALSEDLRERENAVTVTLATGLERGKRPGTVSIWLPPISTCALSAIELAEGSRAEAAVAPQARWLAIGDSLTQGFSVASPLQTWVHRLARRWHAPAHNHGVGGIRIEPKVFAPALEARGYDLVTIALGSNHAWRDAEADEAGARAAELAAIASGGGHQRIVWLLPPWKPWEEGKGPREFAGVPLDDAAARRMERVRTSLRSAIQPFAPRVKLQEDLMPHDLRLLPDGLHPQALGAARYSEALAMALAPPAPLDDGEERA